MEECMNRNMKWDNGGEEKVKGAGGEEWKRQKGCEFRGSDITEHRNASYGDRMWRRPRKSSYSQGDRWEWRKAHRNMNA
jgi:hypothetical protein